MKKKIRISLLISGTLLFYTLFWKEVAGYNALIFTLFTASGILLLFPEAKSSKMFLTVLTGSLLSAFTVAYHASELSVWVWTVSLLLLPAYAQNLELKSVLYAGASTYLNFFTGIGHLSDLQPQKTNKTKLAYYFKIAKLSLLPFVFLYIFYRIFKFANPVFKRISDSFFSRLTKLVEQLFSNISINQIAFFLFGFALMTLFFVKGRYKILAEKEAEKEDVIIRNRIKNIGKNKLRNLSMKLKNEFLSALILMGMVNLLLLIINIIDINWIWFGFEFKNDINLTQFVHEGTYLLILSILLSMGIMLYFFRRNLNFYGKKKILQILTYIWLAQNMILLISVALRNIHYITYYGLAYKRIGLFFFLILVLIGLITLIIKIKDKKTTYYLIKVNSIALYAGFVLFAVPDWDKIIARHNLTSETIIYEDTDFLLRLDAKVLPIIFKYANDDNLKHRAEVKKQFFTTEYKQKSFLSRNYADDKLFQYFNKNTDLGN